MKLKIKQKILMEHLNYVIKGISSKNLIPILNCIKFDLKKEGLYLMSTDNEIAIKTFIDAKDIEEIEEKGDIVVSGKYIYDIIKKLSNEVINLEEIISSQLLITTSRSSFKLNCNNASEFPNLDLEFSKTPITLNQQSFKTMINQTIFATSTQESRPVLTGINFKIKENHFECTATDSYRLARKEIELPEPIEHDIDIIVPAKNLIEITRLLNSDEEDLKLHIFNNKIIFEFGSLIVLSRLINGTYPDTNKLIPEEFAATIRVNLTDFYNSIDRASTLTNEEEKNIIKLESKGDYLLISSNIPEIGNVEEQVDLQEKINESVKIAFSSKYMMDAVKVFDSEEITIKYIQLIVPIRTY